MAADTPKSTGGLGLTHSAVDRHGSAAIKTVNAVRRWSSNGYTEPADATIPEIDELGRLGVVAP